MFNSKYTNSHIVNLSTQCIHGPHIIVDEVVLNLVTTNIDWPVTPHIYDIGSIYVLIFL